MGIYLDSAATTKPSEACIAAMMETMQEAYGNPSSLHHVGVEAQLRVEQARKRIAAVLGCDASAVTFTSGATESNHLAIRGAAGAYGKRKRRVITTTVEHASVRGAFDLLEQQGFEVVRIAPERDGSFDVEKLVAAADENTCLVSMMLVNNETGTILPVKEVFAGLKQRYPQLVTHCDCVQGFLKLPVTPEKLHADLLTISGHKVHACKGVGALYHKRGIRLTPLLAGGEQEAGLRPGTEAVPLIAGFGAAAEELRGSLQTRYAHVTALKERLCAMLSEMDGITVQSPADASPYIVSFSVKGLRSETMLHFLSDEGISVSSGSACSKGKQSGVLQQFGIKNDAADSTLRVSFCAENKEEELRVLVEALAAAQARLVHKKTK